MDQLFSLIFNSTNEVTKITKSTRRENIFLSFNFFSVYFDAVFYFMKFIWFPTYGNLSVKLFVELLLYLSKQCLFAYWIRIIFKKKKIYFISDNYTHSLTLTHFLLSKSKQQQILKIFLAVKLCRSVILVFFKII